MGAGDLDWTGTNSTWSYGGSLGYSPTITVSGTFDPILWNGNIDAACGLTSKVKPKAIAAPKRGSALEWLDERVNEMRVAL